MNEDKATRDFLIKFSKLNDINQKYIIAIQQALLFAQMVEKGAKEKGCDCAS